MPASAVDMRQFFLYMDADTVYPELAATVAPLLLQGELNPFSASRVAESAFDFEPEVEYLDKRFSVLKLHKGSTGVFKDFGIAFLAAVMEELLKNNGRAMVVSAAQGDSGANIAHAFYNRKNITSVILYPKKAIRGLDPAQFVHNGGNILPIQVQGSFDACQRLVREIIEDKPFAERYSITSANAINVGRLLPQAFYYLYAFIKLKRKITGDLVFSVPSGNFGNLIAGLYAWKFGMPVNGFIAAMNANNAFGDYIRGGEFIPKPPISTKSPALDVSKPANYERLAAFYDEAPAVMRNMVYPQSIDDTETLEAIKEAWERYGLQLDPHGAVSFAAAKKLSYSPDFDGHIVILSTGHPAKYAKLFHELTGEQLELPERLQALQRKCEPVAVIEPQIDALESVIAGCC